MYIYQNGNRCPCCGQALHDMSDRELELFSQMICSNGLEPLPEEAPVLQPQTGANLRPPDVGIYPPVKPVLEL